VRAKKTRRGLEGWGPDRPEGMNLVRAEAAAISAGGCGSGHPHPSIPRRSRHIGLAHLSRKRDLRRVDAVAREFGIDRYELGAFLEYCKAQGDRGTENDRGDFTWAEMREKAREFLGQQ
jgi:hypothetical protein